jgi:hypothetical protein
MKLDNTSITLIFIALCIFLYFIYGNGPNEAIDNSGSLVTSSDFVVDESDVVSVDSSSVESSSVESSSSSASSSEALRMVGRNSSIRQGGGYKSSSYKDGSRGGSPDSGLDAYFSSSTASNNNSGDFQGVSSSDNLAQYIPGTSSGNASSTDNMFNSKQLLPKQTNNDWFETYNNVGVKNPHIISVYRPIGANTVSSSLRNPTYDFRGDIVNPRYVVSPWLQSTIDPDTNNRGLCAA